MLRRRSTLPLLLALTVFGCAPPPITEDAGELPADAALADTGAAPTTDTWTTFGNTFMQAYCVRCHDTPPRDFNQLSDVQANAATIRCGVSAAPLDDCGTWPPPSQFPVGGGPFPSEEERARLVAWLDAGAPY